MESHSTLYLCAIRVSRMRAGSCVREDFPGPGVVRCVPDDFQVEQVETDHFLLEDVCVVSFEWLHEPCVRQGLLESFEDEVGEAVDAIVPEVVAEADRMWVEADARREAAVRTEVHLAGLFELHTKSWQDWESGHYEWDGKLVFQRLVEWKEVQEALRALRG